MNSIVLNLLKKHVASSFLFVFFIIIYMYDDHQWVEAILPINGKPLAVFTLIGLALVYEVLKYDIEVKGDARGKVVKELVSELQTLRLSVEIGHLANSVNAMYFRFIASGDKYIENEYTIKEIGSLIDTRKSLGVNSFVEGRLNFLAKHIKAV